MTAEFYANTGGLSGTRDPDDVYETPAYVTWTLLRYVRLDGPVLEPAEGSGRISRVLRETGLEVHGRDIRNGIGDDFMEADEAFPGDIVTNPPYKKKLARRFCEKALELADGRVAMLMRSGFLWSDDRRLMFRRCKPELILILPDRVLFIRRDGRPISGQAHSHEWVVWPERRHRGSEVRTDVVWADDLREKT